MEQTYLNKIISLHLEKCGGNCPHTKECYHIKRKENKLSYNISNNIEIHKSIIRSGYKIHESICSKNRLTKWHIKELKKNKNYNITISANHFSLKLKNILEKNKDQIQISVYDQYNLDVFKDWQKLFLIKNDESYNQFNEWLGKNTGKLHFILDQNYVNSSLIKKIILLFNNKCSKNQSMDNCLTSWLINGRCPYSNGNYIDINYDGTIRTCPYSIKGINPSKAATNLNQLFGLKMLPTRCIYMSIFGETINGTTNNSCI
jgi:hypothetical protein